MTFMVIDMSSISETKKGDLEFYDNFAANSMQACGDVITALNLSGDAAHVPCPQIILESGVAGTRVPAQYAWITPVLSATKGIT